MHNLKEVRKDFNKFKESLINRNIKLDIEADFSSKSAREKIEKLGGKISIKKD